jgi:hypothetical protein
VRSRRGALKRTLPITSAVLMLLAFALGGTLALDTEAQGQQPRKVQKVDMGDYEPVLP